MECCNKGNTPLSTKVQWLGATPGWKSIVHNGAWKNGKLFYKTFEEIVKKSKTELAASDVVLFEQELCAFLTITDTLRKHNNLNGDEFSEAADNVNQIDTWERELSKICKDTKINVVKKKKKNNKKTVKGCTDPNYEEYNEDANTDDGSCKTEINITSKDPIYGCMDTGENLPEGVELNKPYNPDVDTDDGSCLYKTKLSVENNYMFCTDTQDGMFDGCDPSEAKGVNDGYVTGPKTYTLISSYPNKVSTILDNLYGVVSSSLGEMPSVPYVPLRNENKFTKKSTMSLSDDIAKALTISVANTQYYNEAGNDKKWSTYPFTYVTIYSPVGATDPIGEFKIERDLSVDSPIGITGVKPVDSTDTFRRRLDNLSLPSVDPNYVNAINNHLVSALKIKDIKFNNSGLLEERVTSTGLGKLLKKPISGLGDVIK